MESEEKSRRLLSKAIKVSSIYILPILFDILFDFLKFTPIFSKFASEKSNHSVRVSRQNLQHAVEGFQSPQRNRFPILTDEKTKKDYLSLSNRHLHLLTHTVPHFTASSSQVLCPNLYRKKHRIAAKNSEIIGKLIHYHSTSPF